MSRYTRTSSKLLYPCISYAKIHNKDAKVTSFEKLYTILGASSKQTGLNYISKVIYFTNIYVYLKF